MHAGVGRERAAPGVVLLALLVLGVALPRSSAAQRPDSARSTVASRSGRAFEHQRHETISCRSCHGTGSNHRTFLVQTARDCASCHHEETRAQTCKSCHGSSPPENYPVNFVLRLSVWDTARARTLAFSHDKHGKLDCKECHGTPVMLTRNRECTSCHESHHRAEATCSTCHASITERAHGESVHVSCAGSGCHAAAVAPAPTLSRTLCLACHVKQNTHEPGRRCTDCHRISAVHAGQR